MWMMSQIVQLPGLKQTEHGIWCDTVLFLNILSLDGVTYQTPAKMFDMFVFICSYYTLKIVIRLEYTSIVFSNSDQKS